MANLKKMPEFLAAMTADELQDFLSNWTLEDEFDENGNLIREGMLTKAVEWDVIDDLVALLDATSTKKRYPRKAVWNEEKGKTVYVADKSKPQYETTSPIGFFEVKAKFIHEICAVPKVEKEEKEDFRAKIRAAAAAAKAKKANNDKRAEYEAAADAKLAEIKAKAEKG